MGAVQDDSSALIGGVLDVVALEDLLAAVLARDAPMLAWVRGKPSLRQLGARAVRARGVGVAAVALDVGREVAAGYGGRAAALAQGAMHDEVIEHTADEARGRLDGFLVALVGDDGAAGGAGADAGGLVGQGGVEALVAEGVVALQRERVDEDAVADGADEVGVHLVGVFEGPEVEVGFGGGRELVVVRGPLDVLGWGPVQG